MEKNRAKEILIGLSIGDALGVPVEFKTRSYLEKNKVTEMQEYGTHNQPKGTWSDDSSLAFCLAESLLNDYNLIDISKNFIKWVDSSYWTAHNEVFDCGITTGRAIDDLKEIVVLEDYERLPNLIYEGDEYKNGNGSLMRISPLLFYIKGLEIGKQFNIIKEVSSLTHRHIRSAIACLIYLKWMERILYGETKEIAFDNTRKIVNQFLSEIGIVEYERKNFNRILESDLKELKEDEISSSGYVIHSLEATIWCILNTSNYEEAVLKAVNLGDDTDTTGSVVGGIAGLIYGIGNIPENWINLLVKKDEIIILADKLNKKFCT